MLITKTDFPDPVAQGGYISYVITISNQGPTRTVGLFVTDAVPANTTFNSAGVMVAGSNGGDDWVMSTPPVAGTGVVTWAARPILPVFPGDSQLDSGEYAVLYLRVQVKSPLAGGTTITNTATVSASNSVGSKSDAEVTTVAAPRLTIGKFARDVITAGLPLTYTIRITNSGGYTLTGSYIVTEVVPDYVTYDAGSYTDPPASGYDPASRTLTWTLSTPIPPVTLGNNFITVTFVVTVNSPLTNNTQIVNSRYAVTSPQTLAAAAGPPVTTTVRSWADLSLDKIDYPDPVQAGAYLTYTLLVTNDAAATGYALTTTVTDTVPQSTTLVGATGAATQASGTTPGSVVTWTLSSPLAPGESARLTMTLRVTSPLVSGTLIENSQYGVTATDALTPVAGVLVTTTVNSAPAITVTKSVAPAGVPGGGVVTYTIVVINSGNESALVTVTDRLSDGFSFNGMVAPPNPTTLPPPVIVWASQLVTGRDLGGTPGVLTLVFTATAPITGGVYYNLVTATFGISEVATGPTAPVSVGNPDLRLVKSDAPYDPVQAGELLTYTLTYSNASATEATNVVMTDVLPANADFVATYGYSQSFSGPTGGVITWNLGTLNQVDGNRVITLVLSVRSPLTDGTILTNAAGITETTGSFASDVETTTVRSQPILHIVKDSDPPPGGTVQAGGLITYFLTISNTGNATATNTVLTDVVPANTTHASGGTYVAASGWVSFTVGDLGPNTPQSYSFVVNVSSPLADGTIITNSLYAVTSAQTFTVGTVPITHQVVSTHTLYILKDDAPYDPVPSGSLLTYTIAYSVTGNEASSSPVISDEIPANTAYASCAPVLCARVGNAVYWWLSSPLTPGLSGVVTMVVTVTTPLRDQTILTNTANFYDSNGGVTKTDAETTTVVAADVAITKTVTPGVARPDWLVAYTINYQNKGSITATNVFITDTVPLSLTQVVSSSASANFVGGTMPTFTWLHTGDLGPNASGTIVITGRLPTTPWGPLTATLTNTAEITLSGQTADGDDPANPNRVDVPHLVRPDDPYTLTLVAVPLSTTVGSTVALTITVTDRWGNPVLNGTTVNLGTTLGVFVESGAATYTPGTTNGRATATLTSTTAGTATVTAWSGSPVVSDTVIVTFTLGVLDHFAIGYIASPQTAGVGFTIIVTAQDRYSNTLTSYNGTVNLADITGSMLPAVSAAFVNGVWSGTVTITLVMRSDVITASDTVSPTIIGVSNPFTVTPGPPASRIVSYTSPISICGANSWITTTVYDSYGNLVWAGVPVTYSLVAPIRGSLPGGSSHFTATDDQGQATTTFTSGSTTGSQWFLVSVGGLAPLLIMPGIMVVAPGPPTQLLIVAVPDTIPISGTSTVTATLLDCINTPIVGVNVNLSSSPLGTLFPTSGTTDGSGIVTTVFTAGPSGGVATVTATYGSLVATTPITIQAGGVATVTVVAVPDTMPADGSSTTTITATVVSTGGSPVIGQLVNLVILPTLGGTFLTPASGATNASGVFVATWQAGTTPGTTTVTATADSRYGTAPLTLTAGTPTTVTVMAIPDILPANGVSTTVISATVVDIGGAPVAGANVVLSVMLSFGGTFLTPASGNTNAAGIFAATWRSGTVTGTATVTAEVPAYALVDTTTLTLTPTALLTGGIYLPLILKNSTGGPIPDLIVQSIQVIPPAPASGSPVEIRVVVRNVGPGAVDAPFWVDLYIHDSPFPTPTVNQAWNTLVSYGVAWRVYGTIPSGSTRTVTNLWPNDLDNPDTSQRCGNYSNFTPSTAGGCPVSPPYPWPEWRWSGVPNSNSFPHNGTWYIKALADSYSDTGNPQGEIAETNEANNALSLPTIGVTGLSVGTSAPPPLPAPAPPSVGPRPTLDPTGGGD